MDDYKEKLIEMVRARPLLWDHRVPDYKNKDQRTQVWDELKELLTTPKGATPKEVWESLVRCNNNALLRTKTNKKSGSGADKSQPWKFLKQMEFLNPIKVIRNSTGNLPQERDEETDTADDILQTAMIEADILSEVDVPEQFVAVVEKRTGSEQGGKKQKKKKVDDNDDDIISLLRKKSERKPESSRMGFFNSIMRRLETLDDDRFQEFQLQTLQLLKKLCSEQNHQGHFYRQSGQHSLPSYNSFTPITSPLISSMSAPSPSQSYYHPSTSTTLYPFQNPPQSQMSGQAQQSPLRSWQSSFQSTECSQTSMRSQSSGDCSQFGKSAPGPSNSYIQ